MFSNVIVELHGGATLAYTPDQAANQVITAIGGTVGKDTCTVVIQTPSGGGTKQVRITCSTTLQNADAMPYTPDGAAMQVLVALGCDQTKDHCSFNLASATSGNAGKS